MELYDLEIYKIATEVSEDTWKIYERLDWRIRKILGDQWITATDSIGANIAEGFGRYHYLDKNRFNYNARGSLYETIDWLEKSYKRKIISEEEYKGIHRKLTNLGIKLNNYIQTTRARNN